MYYVWTYSKGVFIGRGKSFSVNLLKSQILAIGYKCTPRALSQLETRIYPFSYIKQLTNYKVSNDNK